MHTKELIDALYERGLPDEKRAKRALDATIAVLGERLTSDEALALARVLPQELRGLLDGNGYDGDFDAAELYERVRRRLRGEAPGAAREETQLVLAVIGSLLPPEVRTRLEHALPDEIARLFRSHDLGVPEVSAHTSSARHETTLSSGRPGSRHSFAEGSPPGAQSHSVDREGNPHGETKLSSARGLTQERLDDTLAAGKVGR